MRVVYRLSDSSATSENAQTSKCRFSGSDNQFLFYIFTRSSSVSILILTSTATNSWTMFTKAAGIVGYRRRTICRNSRRQCFFSRICKLQTRVVHPKAISLMIKIFPYVIIYPLARELFAFSQRGVSEVTKAKCSRIENMDHLRSKKGLQKNLRSL